MQQQLYKEVTIGKQGSHTYRYTVKAVYEPKGSDLTDKDCFEREEVRPSRSAAGAHRECGHLF